MGEKKHLLLKTYFKNYFRAPASYNSQLAQYPVTLRNTGESWKQKKQARGITNSK